MSIYRLTIRFRGICTHFRSVVPGIPHRVVLPRTEGVQFGTVAFTFPEAAVPAADYYLTPHFAFIETTGPSNLNVNGIIASINSDTGPKGYLASAARLQVANALDDPIVYSSSYTITRSLREFIPDYEYSEEVVQGGRAACYFDVFHGTIGSGLTADGASSVSIEMQTDGPPQLMVVPLKPLVTGAPPQFLTLAPDAPDGNDVTLTVANLELESIEPDDPQFDYLLHYLTSLAGIPRAIAKPTPGMTNSPTPQTAGNIATGLRGFAAIIDPSGTTPGSTGSFGAALLNAIAHNNTEDVSASCSDSRYP